MMLSEQQLRRELKAAERFAETEPFADDAGNGYLRGIAKGLRIALTGRDRLSRDGPRATITQQRR